jgi:DUF1680 family protein
VTVLRLNGTSAPGPITAIPYFAWDNRGLAPMAVWLKSGDAPVAAIRRE